MKMGATKGKAQIVGTADNMPENGQEMVCARFVFNTNNDEVEKEEVDDTVDLSTAFTKLTTTASLEPTIDSSNISAEEEPLNTMPASQRVISTVELAERILSHLPQIDVYRARILSRDLMATISNSSVLLRKIFVLHRLPRREDPDELHISRYPSYAVQASDIIFQFSLPVSLSIPAHGAMNTTLTNPFVFEPLSTTYPTGALVLRKKFEDQLFGNVDLDPDIHPSNIDCQYVTNPAVWQLYFSVGLKMSQSSCEVQGGGDSETMADDGYHWVNKVVRRQLGVRIVDLKLAIEKAMCSKIGEHYGAGLGIESKVDMLRA
jgi:hypothetical protein